jgi:hypothetical protein
MNELPSVELRGILLIKNSGTQSIVDIKVILL